MPPSSSISALAPDNEPERLAVLWRLHVLDTPAEGAYDDIARLASVICRTPMAMVSLVDQDRVWFKARLGLDLLEIPRARACCAYAILRTDMPFVVADAAADPRFSGNPLFGTGSLGGYYAGAPIVTATGAALGTVCVVDRTPRMLEAAQVDALRVLARQAASLLERRNALPETANRSAELAERSIANERVKLENVLATTSDGIHVLDAAGRLVLFSKSFAAMLGYSFEEARSLRLQDWATALPEQALAQGILADGLTQDVIETKHRRKDGTLIDVELTIRGMRADGEHLLFFSSRDISAKKRAETRARQHVAELEFVNKELDEFVYTASHDLRSPLRAISALAGWIREEDGGVSEKTMERLKLIQNRTARLTRLLDDILAYARLGRSRTVSGERTSAAVVAADTIDTLNVPAGFTIHIDAAMHATPVRPIPLQQVLHNLLGNAIKHHDRPNGMITLTVRRAGRWNRFSVIDDGPGIADEHRETIFDMFTTLKPRDHREGSGMGLAMVRKLVMQLGGVCGVDAVKGRGSRFWFDWPPLDTTADG